MFRGLLFPNIVYNMQCVRDTWCHNNTALSLFDYI